MQNPQTTKAKKLIFRLRKTGIKKSVEPVIIPIPVKEKPSPEKREKRPLHELTKTEKLDLDFYRFQNRMAKKLKAIGVKIASPTVIPQTPKPKGGIMDNIGEIFESNYL